MTGFGRASRQVGTATLTVEIRAVNARQSDIRIKLPGGLREAEHTLRQRLQETALRGRFEVVVELRGAQGATFGPGINGGLYRFYREQLLLLEPSFHNDGAALATAILKLPNVVGSEDESPDPFALTALSEAFEEAIEDFIRFRKTEGEALANDLVTHVAAIQAALPNVETFEPERANRLRERLERLISEQLTGTGVDRSRLEQEVLFYLEKIDISEEKARLRQHCTFFLESMADSDVEKGRRLSFIAQEMGREINTLGAKAYSSDIQRTVVHMKDELEKIKEQLANAV